ncbi:MAG: isoleucine--tRNA ligase [Erythrobacter sp.]|nr:isoleucine--tRNA ligase [Erythrobacter sp.]
MSDDTANRAKEAKDYRDTVFLPKTDFPMKAGLPQKEPGIAARWEQIGLYNALRDARRGREKFILHDGPPYANGDMHIGHALNHILKDMVCRTQNLLDKDAPYVPGWDCHGLPIEWKVEEQYRKKKLNKDEVPAKEFRAECRAYAQHWVDTQREQLKRLGIMGDWDHPYLTMDAAAEGTIVAELLKFAEAGNVYRGSKPVMWSPVEKTALAEAEVEYEDITSTQIDVAFEIIECPNVPELVGAHAVIWTTTPWTIPVNQALAYGPEIKYLLSEFERVDGSTIRVLTAADLIADFEGRAGTPFLKNLGLEKLVKGSDLAGAKARHPIYNFLKSRHPGPRAGVPLPSSGADETSGTPDQVRGDVEGDVGGWEKALAFYATPRPLLPGDFVTTDSGTGLVHMAPDHGEDDFDLCKANGINPVFAVMDDGRYRDDWPWLGGHDERRMSVINPKFNAPDGPICTDLREAGALLAASTNYQHSYPHSWRSKAKVIFRATAQWFVPMDRVMEWIEPKTRAEKGWENEGGAIDPSEETLCASPTLRERAMEEIARVEFIPEKGRNRIGAMVEGRPDWVLSRQRAWGVPITLFVRPDGTYLADPEVNHRIVAAVMQEGVDAWEEARKAEYLGPDYNPADYEMVTDILDVWFDSGCTHAFVLESGRWPDLQWPANLYLEGSDQHRGWFQSSLLQSCATRGRAPYDQVLTHGFTMDAKGRKMSKSEGNTISPVTVMEQTGADIIRLWALSVDFTEDHRIGDEILKGVGDQYRKLRNTFRYLLGALDGFVGDMSDAGALPELEVYILALLAELDAKLKAAAERYDFNLYTRLLVDFCNEDLSAFYFDIRKDSLYCDGSDSVTRNAYRTVLDLLFHALIRYAAPVLVFTAEEVWMTRYPQDGEADEDGQRGSVHLLEWPSVPGVVVDTAKWDALRALRDAVNEAIEPLRRDKTIRSSLEAEVVVPAGAVPEGVSEEQLAELFITATVSRGQGDGVIVTKTTHHKCGRCWRLLPDVAEEAMLCGRCDAVVAALDGAA